MTQDLELHSLGIDTGMVGEQPSKVARCSNRDCESNCMLDPASRMEMLPAEVSVDHMLSDAEAQLSM